MAVYVNQGKISYRRMKMYHMLVDTVEELHVTAGRLGLKRPWFQSHSIPHYDICQSKRNLAIEYRAIVIDRREQ